MSSELRRRLLLYAGSTAKSDTAQGEPVQAVNVPSAGGSGNKQVCVSVFCERLGSEASVPDISLSASANAKFAHRFHPRSRAVSSSQRSHTEKKDHCTGQIYARTRGEK